MTDFYKKLNLIDLISEKHSTLRNKSENLWSEQSDIVISHTEGHLLARINQGTLSITMAAKRLNISRQAMHKCSRNLEQRGFLEFYHKEGNSKEKYMSLTEKGREYCRDSDKLKEKLEQQIAVKLGKDNVLFLKNLLRTNWLDTDL